MARARRDAEPAVEVLVDPVDRFVAVHDLPRHADPPEDLLVLLLGRARHEDLVVDPSQERLVDQVERVEVGREDEERVERHRELVPGMQREIVHPLLERHDPPVEQVAGTHALPPEVVDDQHASVRLHLERRLVHLAVRVVLQIELVQRQLAPGEHDRALHAREAPVVDVHGLQPVFLRLVPVHPAVRQRAVVHRIEDHHDVTVDIHRVRDEQVATHHSGDRFGEVRLPVPRVAVQEHGFRRVDRRPQLVEELRIQDQVAEADLDPLAAHADALDRLPFDPFAVLGERHRRRADVVVRVHRLAGALAALPREIERVAAASVPLGPANLDELPLLQVEETIVDQGEGNADRVGELLTRSRPLDVQALEDEVDQRLGRDPGVLERLRNRRHGTGAELRPAVEARPGPCGRAQFSPQTIRSPTVVLVSASMPAGTSSA